MAANKIVHEPGKYFDCTSMHGKWCTITMVGQDVGYARVGIISSDAIIYCFSSGIKRDWLQKRMSNISWKLK